MVDANSLDSHVVLFDKKETLDKNDEFYYFNESRGPTNPFIQIPKKRGTFQHFDFMLKASHGELAPALLSQFQNWNDDDVKKYFENISPGIQLKREPCPFWTVGSLFVLSINKK